MSESLQIPGANMVALEAIADSAGVDVQTFIGQSIGLGLNLADLTTESGGTAAVLFEQPDKSYTQYAIDFSPVARPALDEEMVGFECGLDYQPPFELVLPPLALLTIETAAERMVTNRGSFIETGFFFRYQWALTRQRHGDILIDDTGSESQDYLIVENDDLIFKYDIAI